MCKKLCKFPGLSASGPYRSGRSRVAYPASVLVAVPLLSAVIRAVPGEGLGVRSQIVVSNFVAAAARNAAR